MSILKSLKTTLILGFGLCFGLSLCAQETRSVLTPESFNEARLNGLQPPEQVMDFVKRMPVKG